jgi:DNA polymerase
MRLVALELLEGVEVGILIAQADHQSHRDLVVFQVIEERAAIGVVVERPSRGVHDEPRHVLLGLHLPQLLQADAVDLRPAAFAQLEALLELAAEISAASLGEHRVLGVQLDARLVARGLLAVLADAHVARGHAAHAAVFGVEDFRGGEARIDLDARGLGLRAQPAADVAQARDVVAVILEARRAASTTGTWREPSFERKRKRSSVTGVFNGAPSFFQSGRSSSRPRGSMTGAGEDVGSDFRAFLDDADRDFLAVDAASWRRRIAVASPDGPAPTTTTS